MWNVATWLDDVENTPFATTKPVLSPLSRKRTRVSDSDLRTAAPQPTKRRRGLAALGSNACAMPPHTTRTSVRTTRGTRKTVQEEDFDEGPTQETPRPPAPTSTITADPDVRFFPPSHYPRAASSPSRASGKSISTTGSKSPVKDVVDLRLADNPICFCSREDVELPHCLEALCTALDNIADGDGLVPREISDRVKALKENKLRSRHVAVDMEAPDLDLDDFRVITDICKDARRQEAMGTSEAAWNCEVHTPVLRMALRPSEERIYFDNITTATPIPNFVPAREAQTLESRLVDYSINFNPSSEERRLVNAFLTRQPPTTSTMTQTMYPAVRERPCIVSIETKTTSNSDKARAQLAVWSAAHVARAREWVTPAAHEKDEILLVHPVIHVQLHEWRIYLAVAKTDTTAIDIVDVDITLGGTKNLLELWKLRASLRFLVDWADGEYRGVLFECVKTYLAAT